MKPDSAAPAHVPVPAGKLVRSPPAVLLHPKVSPRSAATVLPALCPLVGQRTAQERCSLKCSRIWSNSQSHAGPYPSGDGLLPLNRGRESVTAIPTFRDRAEE